MGNSYIVIFYNWLAARYAATLLIVVPLVCWAVQALGKCLVFRKAGRKSWYGFIPVLSDWHQLDLSWNTMIAWFWVGVLVLSGLFVSGAVNAVFHIKPYIHDALMIVLLITLAIIMIIDCYQLSRAFGKKFFFALGLFFLFPIFMVILGLDSSKYLGPQE